MLGNATTADLNQNINKVNNANNNSVAAATTTMTLAKSMTANMPIGPNSNVATGTGAANATTNAFASQPAVIDKGPIRVVITDSPSDFTINKHIHLLKKYNVKHVCRASEPSYDTAPLLKAGIQVHELAFPDGDAPPEHILEKWLDLVEQCFIKNTSKKSYDVLAKKQNDKEKITKTESATAILEKEKVQPLDVVEKERISVHCVAGLGRAPVLVAVALVEFCNMDAVEAVSFIRQQRRGAINRKQVKWLENYKRRRRIRSRGISNIASGCLGPDQCNIL